MLGKLFILLWPKNKLRSFLYEHFGIKAFSLHNYKYSVTHPSFSTDSQEVNGFERLEFLGDGVIDLVVSHLLMEVFPEEDEGSLTKLKSFVVSRKTLGKIAKDINLPEILRADARSFSPRTSIYGNSLEAIIGAIYLDKGFLGAEKSVKYLFSHHITFKDLLEKAHNFKGEVIEWAQKNKKLWKLESQELPQKKFLASLLIDHQIQTVAVSSSKKEAEQKACRIFWDLSFNIADKEGLGELKS